jgi:type IV pilus assembly protein PilA
MIKVHRNSKGFTLIELLIVIAIIGILAAIAIPAYTGYTKKSKVSGVVNAMGAVKNACAAYYTDRGNLNNVNFNLTQIGNFLGINVPQQYISAATVNNSSADGVVLNFVLTNIGTGVDGAYINLTSSNIGSGATWTWGGNIDASYLPKN